MSVVAVGGTVTAARAQGAAARRLPRADRGAGPPRPRPAHPTPQRRCLHSGAGAVRRADSRSARAARPPRCGRAAPATGRGAAVRPRPSRSSEDDWGGAASGTGHPCRWRARCDSFGAMPRDIVVRGGGDEKMPIAANLDVLLDKAYENVGPRELLDAPVAALAGVTDADAGSGPHPRDGSIGASPPVPLTLGRQGFRPGGVGGRRGQPRLAGIRRNRAVVAHLARRPARRVVAVDGPVCM